MKRWIVAVLTVFGLTFSAQAAPVGLPDFSHLVEKEGKAVVHVSTTVTTVEKDDEMDIFQQFGFPFAPPGFRGRPQQPRERQSQGLGSGFIIESDGYILTNAHVVADANEITVKLTDKRTFKARLIGSDARTDVALLKIEATQLPKVDIGNVDKLKVGEWVVAIGAPYGLENTVTAGIVSAKGRNLPDENFVPFIQTDAAVNPGNSGGPLFNVNGEVVGINSQIYSRSGGYMGLSFAIPMDVAMKVAGELKQSGKVQRARIGVTIQEVSEEVAQSFGLSKAAGALVNSVEKEGPGDKSGVKAGDIILKFNGQAIATSSDLPKLVGANKPGSKATLHIWRDGAGLDISVVLGELESLDKNSARRDRKNKPSEDDNGRLGLRLADVPPQQLKELGVKFGMQVVEASGVAAKAGLQQGDLIVGVGNQELSSKAQLREKFSELKASQRLALRVIRQGQSLFLVLKAPEK